MPDLVNSLNTGTSNVVLAPDAGISQSDLGDGIHPNLVGREKLANAVNQAINQVITAP